MGDVKQFVVQEWHIVVLFFTIVGGIFKSEISNALTSWVIILEQRELTGQTVQLLGLDGNWKTVIIVSYQQEIPFFRTGGVVLRHEEQTDGFNHEKIHFQNWKTQRLRSKQP